MVSFHRFGPDSIIFAITAFQTAKQSSQFARSSIARCRAPAPLGGTGKSVASERVALFGGKRSPTSDLNTALEWLAKDRSRNQPTRHHDIRWIHPKMSIDSNEAEPTDENGTVVERMPIYPMEACYIPYSGENCTIVNIEQNNVQMAMDLVNGTWENSLFCASLRARDTGRIASVGTILQLLATDDRSISGATTWPGNVLPTINRVVAHCRAVGIADILSIEGQGPREGNYLVGRVQVRDLPGASFRESGSGTIDKAGNPDSIAKRAINEYQQVRSIYVNSQSLANNELPKFAQRAVQTLPTFDASAACDETTFWKLIETWQMLCNTIRQAKRTSLQNAVNELSVRAAMEAGGPLELPVKRERLPAEVRWQLDEMERRASRDFAELGMDPILDFQEILSMTERQERAKKLVWMISRERLRLEAKESLIRTFLQEESREGLEEDLLSASSENGQTVFD